MHGYLRSSLTKKRHYLRQYCYHDVRRDATMQKELEWCSKTSQLTRHGDKLW